MPRGPARDTPALPRPAERAGLVDGVGRRDPPPSTRSDHRARGGEPPQHLPHRERRAVGAGGERVEQRGIVDEVTEGGRREGLQGQRRQTACLTQRVEDVRAGLGGPVRQHGRERPDPGQHGPQERETAGIGPLQIVDDQRRAGHLQHVQATGEDQRTAALAVEGGGSGVDLGEQRGERAPRAGGQGVGDSGVEGQRLAQQRPREPPRLVAFGEVGLRGDDGHVRRPSELGQQPGLPCPRRTGQADDAPRRDRGPQPTQLVVATDERRPRGRRPHRRGPRPRCRDCDVLARQPFP
ncbi:MAG: hypothetical protein ABT15_22490 [Pseudonocardia sp. SCN 73-27]|nr:hypothetical protein [Pseudonocardia sp. SCN 73-27]ODV03601.1 MAG: hypothetical protein ABT15_22490 [Pseudonocardia sp. SCN 73-27]